MFGSNVLEVALGLVLTYTLLSLFCSVINEQVFVRFLRSRATHLRNGITSMLDTILVDSGDQKFTGEELTDLLYEHGLILSMTHKKKKGKDQNNKGKKDKDKKGKTTGPSYISSHIFALALKDVLTDKQITLEHVPALKPIWQAIQQDVDKQLASIEQWYNDTMDRVSGWYKRRAQLVILLLGFIVTVILNVDTISVITRLSNDSTLRATYISAAQGFVNRQASNTSSQVQQGSANGQTSISLPDIINSVEGLQPPIGWSSFPLSTDPGFWFSKIAGLLTTTFAISLGADFWFGLLKNFIRLSGPTPTSNAGSSASKSTVSQ